MKCAAPIWLSILFFCAQLPVRAAEPAVISGVTLNTPRVARYGKLEISFNVAVQAENPYDPEQIDVRAVIRTPSGRQVFANAFYYQGFVREAEKDGGEKLFANGKPMWKVRYAPHERGTHYFSIEVRTGDAYFESPEYSFRCIDGDERGFLRVSGNDQSFEFDNGTPYFAVGLNTCWGRSTFDYDQWFPKLSENGGNFGRLWIGPMTLFTLEDQKTLGHYSEANAWRLDYVTDLAQQKNIYLMFCLESFNSLRIQPEYERWNENPYNAANGGPCAEPPEFFTNAQARKLFKRRLRYIAARWGYSTHVFAWEFWNEVDLVEKYESLPVREWHIEMARYMRRIDPNRHLMSTSFANSEGDSLIDTLPEMNFVQTHNYGASDIAAELSRYCFEKSRRYEKPHFVGEFGLHWEGKGNEKDKDGAHLIEGMWSAALSQSAGTAMTWWWDTYVAPQDLWMVYAPIAKFAAKTDWRAHSFRRAEVELSYATPQPPHSFDLFLQGRQSIWDEHPSNAPQEVMVNRDGTILGTENLSGNLHGKGNHPTWHNPLAINVDGASEWKLSVFVSAVSGYGGATLKIFLDDDPILLKKFEEAEPKRDGVMHQYDGEYAVQIPAGKHQIKIVNDGKDWMSCSFKFAGYAQRFSPELRAFGLADGNEALIWVQNDTQSFRAKNSGTKAEPVKAGLLTVLGMADGDYSIEFWNTRTSAMDETAAHSAQGQLKILLPTIETDLGLRARRK